MRSMYEHILHASSGAATEAGTTAEVLIRRPATVHVVGRTDTIVNPSSSLTLASLFAPATMCIAGEGSEIVMHDGGHYVPGGKAISTPILAFLQAQLDLKEWEETAVAAY